MGYDASRPKLWRLEAFTSKAQPDWEAFLGALGGTPLRVVSDNDHGLTNAVRARFPDAELYLCEWHLRHALERLMSKIRAEDGHQETIDELLPQVEAAFTGRSFWAPFLERAHAVGPAPERVAEHHRADRRGPVHPPRTALRASHGHAAEHIAAG